MSQPIKALIIKRDGNMFFAHFDDFTNLQESPGGFGYTIPMAIEDLSKEANQRISLSEFE
jgi:hypothetical protein